MDTESQPSKEQEGAIPALNAAIEAMNLARKLSTIAQAGNVFGFVSVTLTMLRVSSFRFAW